MATLYFKVGADYDKVIRLRDEIKKLENQLKSFGTSTPDAEIKRTEERLASNRQEFTRLATEAAKAGAVMKDGLKKKIDSVTKSSDELSAEIIKQRAIIRETKEDVRMLSEQYSKLGKYSPQSAATLAQLNKAKAALNEQKYALGELQGQQASNRLEIRQLTRQYREFSEETDKSTVTVDALMSSLKRTAAEIGGLAAIKKFGTDVINATGTMQQLQVSLSTILQDGEKASRLIEEITQFAAKTPFELNDVAEGAKQLLAYGSSAENVVDELSMLGDVAAGLQIPIGQLIYLYGTLRTQGRAMTVDIRQFAGRGIPIYEELAKVLGVTKDQVGELVTAGKVGFNEVEQAFKNMTSEGGKFNDLMENSAGTWPQRLSNIQDTLFQKLNDFGNKYKEVFEFGIGTTEELVEHLDDVISVIGGLIAAYGTYKAALIATAVAQKAVGFVESIRLIMAYRKQMGLATAAQQAFNLAAKSNVYVALLSVLVGLGTAIYMFTKRTNEATASQEALSKVNKKADEEFSTQAATIDRLNGVLKSETASLEQKKEALDKLQSIIPDYNASLSKEGELINDNTEAIKAYLTQLEKQIKLKAAQEELEELYRSKRLQEKNVQTQQANYDRTRKQNPIGVVYGGDAGIEAQRQSLNRIAEAEKSLKDANDELKDTQTQIAAIEKEIEQTSLASSKAQKPMSSLSNEIKNATEKIKNLKKEIAGLRSGSVKAEAGKTVEDTIEAKNKELQAAEKSLETLTGNSNKTSTKAENGRKKLAEQRKKAQEQLSNDLLSLQQKNQDDEIALMQDGTQKRLAEVKNDYAKRMAEIDKQEAEFKKKNKEARVAIYDVRGLTKEQLDALQKARDNAAKEQEKQTNEIYLAEAQAMRDYLKQYGTFQQQKLAIAEEYAEKIKKAQSDGERLSLTAERDSSLQQIEINTIRQNIDWGSVFGDFGTMFKDQLQPTIDQLRQIAQSDTFRQSSIEDQKTLYELIDKLEQSNAVWDSDIFKRVSDDIKAYQQAMENYTKSVNDARKAEADYVNAQKAHDAALKAGNSSMIQAAQAAVDETRSAYMAASEQVKTFGTQVQNTTTDLNSSALQAKSMFENLADGLQGLSSGSLQGIGNGIMQLDKLFSGGELTKDAGNAIAKGFQSLLGKDSKAAKVLSEALGSSGLAGQIISAILGMLDILAQGGIGGLVSNLYDTVSNAVNGILEDVLSGGIITKPLNSVVQGAKNILNTITFGGLNSWLGGNDKAVMETVNRLTESNEYLRESIDRLRERISDSGATNEQSVEYYNNAREAELEWEENQRNIIKNLASAWTNTGYGFLGLGGKSSFNSHAPGSSWSGWDAFTETLRNNGINITIDEVGDLWNLTPEQMALLRDNNPKEWQKLFSGDGHKNPLSKVEEYIERAGTLEELTNALNEKLTGYSWDGFLDQYKSLIKEMEGGMSDFGDFINETISNALIEAFVNERLQDDIKDLYEYIANAAPDGLSEEEIEEIRRQNEAIANQAAAWKESMVEAGLITENTDKTQQSASSKGFETMSQDTGDALNGRMTAIYEAELNIANTTTEQLAVLKAIYGQIGGNMADVASESKQILSTSYIQQNNISFPTAQLDALVDKVDKLDAKVADLVSFGADNRLSMQGVDTYIENSTKNNSQSLSLLTDIKRNTQAL